MQLIRKVALCFAVTLCLPVMLVGYELPLATPEEVGLSAEKLQSVPEVRHAKYKVGWAYSKSKVCL